MPVIIIEEEMNTPTHRAATLALSMLAVGCGGGSRAPGPTPPPDPALAAQGTQVFRFPDRVI